MATPTIVYDGTVSGAAIAASLTAAVSGAVCMQFSYANGMRVLIVKPG